MIRTLYIITLINLYRMEQVLLFLNLEIKINNLKYK